MAEQQETATSEPPMQEATHMLNWQRRLLPVMVAMVVGLAVFFFAASLFQLYSLQKSIADSPNLKLDAELAKMEIASKPEQAEALLKLQRWKTLTRLEAHAIKQRYHQANVLLMARVWVRYLGFVTGMILALVGAVFVLGKIKEDRSDVGIAPKGIKATLSTTSPGLVLAFLGVVLMLTTLVTHHQIGVDDGPLYVVLPYAKIQQSGVVEKQPEDVENLSTESPDGDSPDGSSPSQTSKGQEELDKVVEEVESEFQ